jgi:pseudaminic acid biosynthesis-associated methylase
MRSNAHQGADSMEDMVATKQETLWRGNFGDAYTDRNATTEARIAALTSHWSRILRPTMGRPPESVLECGANVGLNLRALKRLMDIECYALEPNQRARQTLLQDGVVDEAHLMNGLCSNVPLPDASVDLTFTSGVLIHVPPEQLLASCRELYRISKRYVVCIEYFSDKAEEIPYRGQTEALFKRDFGSFYLDNFPDLYVLDYGFAWKRVTGLDNLTWWLFAKP